MVLNVKAALFLTKCDHFYASLIALHSLIFFLAVTFPKNPIPSSYPSRSWRRSMQSQYQLPHPLPPLPVRKGVRGRRPKSQTIAMLKAIQNGQTQSQSSTNKSAESEHLEPRLHKKRGPKPGSKVELTGGSTSEQCHSHSSILMIIC